MFKKSIRHILNSSKTCIGKISVIRCEGDSKLTKMCLIGRALSFSHLSRSCTWNLFDLIAEVNSLTMYTFPKNKKNKIKDVYKKY